MAEQYPMDATPEEIYAVTSKETIKLRWNNGTDIIEKYLEVVGKPLSTTENIITYRIRKVYFQNGVAKGIGAHTKIEDRVLYTTSTIQNAVYRVLRLLRLNGYQIMYPKKEKRTR